MVIWIAVLTVVVALDTGPLKFSYPLASPFHTSRECQAKGDEEFYLMVNSLRDNGIPILELTSNCYSFPDKGFT